MRSNLIAAGWSGCCLGGWRGAVFSCWRSVTAFGTVGDGGDTALPAGAAVSVY